MLHSDVFGCGYLNVHAYVLLCSTSHNPVHQLACKNGGKKQNGEKEHFVEVLLVVIFDWFYFE